MKPTPIRDGLWLSLFAVAPLAIATMIFASRAERERYVDFVAFVDTAAALTREAVDRHVDAVIEAARARALDQLAGRAPGHVDPNLAPAMPRLAIFDADGRRVWASPPRPEALLEPDPPEHLEDARLPGLRAERVETTGVRSWVPIVFPLEDHHLVWLAFDLDELQLAIHPIVSEVTFTQMEVGLLRRDGAPIMVAGRPAPDWPDGPPDDGVIGSHASRRLPVDVVVATFVDDGAVDDARSRMWLVAAIAVALAFMLAFGRAWWRRRNTQAPTTVARRS